MGQNCVCFQQSTTIDIDGLIVIDDIRRCFGDFHLLGDGCSSNVFRVLRREDNKKLALKKMSRKSEMNFSLFKAESSILEELNHPHIVQFEEVYMDRKNYYIVTQLCSGGDLLRHIKEKYSGKYGSKFTEAFVANLINQIVEAVAYCHSKNVVHRDIKPENFVFQEEEMDSKLILIDFGIAKVVEEGKNYIDLVGTPYYIAPEYLTKSERTASELKAADMWSIGIVSYVLCTGRPPFHGNTNEEVFRKIISKQLKFPRRARLSSKGKLFLKKILQKDPHARPTAEELKLHIWLNGGAEENDLEVVQGLISFNLKEKMKKVLSENLGTQRTEQTEHVAELFRGIDKNGDGAIDLGELQQFLKHAGYPSYYIEKKSKEIMDKLDVDKSGHLDVKEFEEAWLEFQLSRDDKLMYTLFNHFDANGDGIIDSLEMKAILGENCDEMKKVFDSFDENNNGEVSYEEFVRAMKGIGFNADPNDDTFGDIFNADFDFTGEDESVAPDSSVKDLAECVDLSNIQLNVK